MNTYRCLIWGLAVLGLVVAATPSLAVGTRPGVDITVDDQGDKIVLDYSFDAYAAESVRLDGVEYVKVMLGKESQICEKGAPDVANVCRSVVISDDAKMEIKVLAQEYYDVENIDIVSSKGHLPRTVNPDNVPYTFGVAYTTDAFYPGELAMLGEPYILRDCRGAVVTINPFQYNPVTRVLRVYTTVTVEVAAVGEGQVNVLTYRPETLSRAFDDLYQGHFLNYSREKFGQRYDPLSEEGDLLVIYHDPWASNVAPLVDHKNSIGLSTTMVAVSVIGNDSVSIKNYIQDEYDGGDLAFVLLVGDAAQVDTPYASGGSSDPSYSLLAGSDNYPEIFVGRFSSENTDHVDTQVERTIEYELMPATLQEWFWRGMGVASNQGPGDDGEYDDEHMDNIRDDLLAFGYTEVDQIYDYSGTAAMVTSGLNDGRGIINYCGHGSTTSWGSTGFSNSHVNALENDSMLPFIISVACVNGRFDGYTCFGEAWLRATHDGEPTGAIGAYMSSINQSWNSPMCGQDEVVDRFVDPEEPYSTFGALCFAGSCQMMDEYGADGVNMFKTWHVFGDPSVQVLNTFRAVSISFPDGLPELLLPGEPTDITVQIDQGTEGCIPGSGELHYRYDDGEFITLQLEPLGDDLYLATLPAPTCDSVPEFYFSAEGAESGTIYEPADAPAQIFIAGVGEKVIVMSDDFETDQGWTIENIDLVDGEWERGTPVGGGLRGDPSGDYDGSGQCYLTANRIGNSDVDGGPGRLISPTLDLAVAVDPMLRYARWFTNDDLDEDRMDVEISNDGGDSWVLIESVPHDDGWIERMIRMGDFIDPTSQVLVRFSVTDSPNNSIDEGAIDAFSVWWYQCESGDQCPWDLNGNGEVNALDVGEVKQRYGCSVGTGDSMCDQADLNGNGQVNALDAGEVKANYGPCP